MERKALLAALKEAACGISKVELLEQSNCFVFQGGRLRTFNDEISYDAPSPMPGVDDVAVPAADLLALLAKLPDDEVEVGVDTEGGELVVKGARRAAGLAVQSEILLPVGDIPAPGKWAKLTDEVASSMRQAADTCGNDLSAPLTTVVHVTPDRVEACDNYRYLRAQLATGFPKPVCIPAASVDVLCGMTPTHVSVGTGWVHFRLPSKAVVSVRASGEEYHKGVEELLDLGPKPVQCTLPGNVIEMLERAGLMVEPGYDARVGVRVVDGKLTITARKQEGWYRESRPVKYTGPKLAFDANPRFLIDAFDRTRTVRVGKNRMLLETGNTTFVVSLDVVADKTE